MGIFEEGDRRWEQGAEYLFYIGTEATEVRDLEEYDQAVPCGSQLRTHSSTGIELTVVISLCFSDGIEIVHEDVEVER